MRDTVNSHYLGQSGKAYAEGRFGTAQSVGRRWQSRYFAPWCHADWTVMDFGCGDGMLLSMLIAARKIAVEVNPHCIEAIRANNVMPPGCLEVHDGLDSVAVGSVDLAISNHSLEHVPEPLAAIRGIRRALKPDGLLVIVTPFDDWRMRGNRAYRADNRDQHLYTWSPMNMGNLLAMAGLEVRVSRVHHTAWSPRLFWVKRWLGVAAWRLSCAGWAWATNRREVETVACNTSQPM